MASGPVQAEAVCKLWCIDWRFQLPGPGKALGMALGAAIGELREVAGCVSWGVGACVSTGVSLPGVSACVSVGVGVWVVIYW